MFIQTVTCDDWNEPFEGFAVKIDGEVKMKLEHYPGQREDSSLFRSFSAVLGVSSMIQDAFKAGVLSGDENDLMVESVDVETEREFFEWIVG